MSEFYKSSLTKLASAPHPAAAFNLTQKFPDVSAILNSCDEMIKIANHTREKAKLLQKQMGDLTRAIPMRPATAKRPTTVSYSPSLPNKPQTTTTTAIDYEMQSIQVTKEPKQMLSSCSSSSSVISSEQKAVVKLKGITTINPVMTASVVPSKRIQGAKGARKSDTTKSVQKITHQRRPNSVLPMQRNKTPKTPVSADKPKVRALPNLLPPFKKSSSTNSAGSQMRVTSAKVAGNGSVGGGSAVVSPRLVRIGRE